MFGSLRDEIVIKLGALNEQEKIRFSQLWISGHLTDYLKSSAYHPISFMSTKRQIRFNAKDMTKAVTYTRDDLAKPLIITSHFKEGIYKAGDKLDILYRAIFIQFILELRYLGPKFQQFFWQRNNDKQFVINVFHILFQSVIYPEVKLPVSVPLNKPYIVKLRHSNNYFNNIKRITKVIKKGNCDDLVNCLTEGTPVNIQNHDMGDIPLIQALNQHRMDLIDVLLANGADPLLSNNLGESAIIIAIKRGEIALLKKFLTAISHKNIPDIKYHIDLELNQNFIHEIVSAACSSPKANEILNLLLLHGLKISPDLPIVIWLYRSRKIALMKTFIEQHGANISITIGGKSVLMMAAENGDEENANYFIGKGININLQLTTSDTSIPKEEGWTALHFTAAAIGRENMINLLLSHRVDPYLTSWCGDTAADIATQRAAEDYQTFLKRNNYDSQIDGYVSACFMLYQGAVAKNMAETVMNDFIDRYKTQFSDAKSKYTAVKEIFDKSHLSRLPQDKTPLQNCTSRKFTCAAIITGIINGQNHIILIRKADQQGKVHGFYMAPGGFKDDKDSSYIEAVKREVFEEIGIIITEDMRINEIHSFDHINCDERRLICHKFFHIQMGNRLERLKVFARDDAVETICAKWSDVQQSEGGYFINGIRIQQSNAVIIDKLLSQQDLCQQSINDLLEFESYTGYTDLVEALQSNDIEKIHTLCRRGLDLTDINCIHIAGKAGKNLEMTKEIISLLLQYQANINHLMRVMIGPNVEFHTPLTYMINSGLLDIAKCLISFGADINLMVKNTSPLIAACRLGVREFVLYLIQHGATLDQNLGGCALLTAISCYHFEIAQDLLSCNKINLNKPYSFGGNNIISSNETFLLFFAIRRHSIPSIKLLLNAHASVLVTENGEITALDFARKMQQQNNETVERKNQMASSFANQAKESVSDTVLPQSTLFGTRDKNELTKLSIAQLEQDIIDPEIMNEIVQLMEAAAKDELSPKLKYNV